MKKYFSYNEENISGKTFFIRNLLQSFLSMLLIGVYLQSVTSFKRTMSITNNKLFSWIISLLYCYLICYHLLLNIVSTTVGGIKDESGILVHNILVIILVLLLIFYPGKHTNKDNQSGGQDGQYKSSHLDLNDGYGLSPKNI